MRIGILASDTLYEHMIGINGQHDLGWSQWQLEQNDNTHLAFLGETHFLAPGSCIPGFRTAGAEARSQEGPLVVENLWPSGHFGVDKQHEDSLVPFPSWGHHLAR